MKTSALFAVALVAVASTDSGAQESNPLHPRHFWQRGQPATLAVSEAGFAATVPTNPLHPRYFAATMLDGAFVGAGDSQNVGYVDHRNPLHPGYGRK
jgi:hypothetical protein